jgi:hypothetical protein
MSDSLMGMESAPTGPEMNNQAITMVTMTLFLEFMIYLLLEV